MPDLIQLGFSLGVLVAAVGAIVSVVMTFRMSLALRQIERRIATKEGQVVSTANEEDVKSPHPLPADGVGEADE
ncbi:hypothetical protein ASD04_15575 [Devosia sp. Root436]|uniref:hypothetical protein n=1 Tax=Devosia sp. Root436 TaxID=1736537 RepID=UPI0006F623B5|nr:hypothetical protein [Devosia sp. Root436]KQX34810.1 hypothetical protein ASD04_15575 [Devosia sp. Root436]